MLGFIYRLYIQHPDDEQNPLIYLQLSYDYKRTGLFMAGQSYMMRGQTKNQCVSMMNEIWRMGKKLPEPNTECWWPGPGYYTVRQQKEMYIISLIRYISTLTKIDSTFRYVTDTDKKLLYLTDKLKQLNQYYESDLFSAEMQMREQWDWHIYSYRKPPAISGAYWERDLTGFT